MIFNDVTTLSHCSVAYAARFADSLGVIMKNCICAPSRFLLIVTRVNAGNGRSRITIAVYGFIGPIGRIDGHFVATLFSTFQDTRGESSRAKLWRRSMTTREESPTASAFAVVCVTARILANMKMITSNKGPPVRGDVRRELEFPAVPL